MPGDHTAEPTALASWAERPVAPLTLVLVEDRPADRDEVLQALHGSEFQVVAVADSLQAASDLLALPPPAVALVDMHLPDGLGSVFLAAARERWGQATALMVLSSFADKAAIGRAIAHGAQGYATKGARPELLRARVRRLLADGYCFGPNVALTIWEDATSEGATKAVTQAVAGPVTERLTPAEERVLGLMAQGLQNSEMAASLGVKVGTVKTHVSAILAKTSAPNRLSAVNQARALGWL